MNQYDMDVLVLGGGVAGVAAAVTAARQGLRTLLVENLTSLGGLVTNNIVLSLGGYEGFGKELSDRLRAKGLLNENVSPPAVEPEKCKFELEAMVLQSGCRLLYNIRACDVVMNGSDIESAVCYSKSGRSEIKARIFIDTTGDADIAVAAGVPYDVGDAEYMGLNAAHSMCIRMTNVNMAKYRDAAKAWQDAGNASPTSFSYVGELMDKAVENGDLPYAIFPGAQLGQIPGTPDEAACVACNFTGSLYGHCADTDDLSRQLVELHQQVQWLEEAYKKYVPGFENSRMSGLSCLPGIRDSRRIVGEYILSDMDILTAARFEDAITRSNVLLNTHHPTSGYWGFRHHIHSKEPIQGAFNLTEPCDKAMHPFCPPEEGTYSVYHNSATYFEVPYRCLVPLKVDNLLVAGRCISSEFHANGSVRGVPASMATGQAAAIAAKLCIEKGISNRELDGSLVRQALIDAGVPLDQVPDKFKEAAAKASHEDKELFRLRGDWVGGRQPDGKIIMHR